MKFINLVLYKQLAHLLLMHQGTTKEEEKASITTLESVSNQKFVQPFSSAISMAVMAAQKYQLNKSKQNKKNKIYKKLK
jgi:SRSO17 transposase